jgi:four helix bundle protein
MLNETKNNEENEILDLSFDFALEIIKLVKYLKANKEFVMSSQLLRSGTSIGANISEAQAAQSTNDFISKMSIASKEARETEYWLRLLDKSNYLDEYQNKSVLFSSIQSIVKLLTSIIKTTQEKN